MNEQQDPVLDWLRAFVALPRWRRWLYGALPGHRVFYPLLDWLVKPCREAVR